MTSYYKQYANPFEAMASARQARLVAAIAEAEHLGGIDIFDMAVYSANVSLSVGDIAGAAHRAADIAEAIAEAIECGEYEARGAEYSIGLELWRASKAVLAAAGGRA